MTKWKQIPIPVQMKEAQKRGLLEQDLAIYKKGDFTCMVGTMPNGKKHLSISHPWRVVTWEEIKDARYEFIIGKRYMAMILPPLDEYVNLHQNCWHLHEVEPEEGWTYE